MTFAYHRAIAPMMWAIFALSVAEVAVVHLMLGFWFPRAALVLTAMSLVFVAWLGWAIASFKRLPVVLGKQALTMRAGRIKSLEIPLASIEDIIAEPSSQQINAAGVLDLAIIAHANVLVTLKMPMPRGGFFARRPVVAIAHRLDDPAAFIAVIRSQIA